MRKTDGLMRTTVNVPLNLMTFAVLYILVILFLGRVELNDAFQERISQNHFIASPTESRLSIRIVEHILSLFLLDAHFYCLRIFLVFFLSHLFFFYFSLYVGNETCTRERYMGF